MSERVQIALECKICFAKPSEPIATFCGHVFCWPCLFGWSQIRKSEKVPCPSCAQEVEVNKVIPLYVGLEVDKPRGNIPQRPVSTQPKFRPPQAENNGAGFFPFNFFFGGGANPRMPDNRRPSIVIALVSFLLMFSPVILDVIHSLIVLVVGTVVSVPSANTLEESSFFDIDEVLDILTLLIFVVIFALGVFLFKKVSNRRNQR